MIAFRDSHELFGSLDQREQTFAELDRHDGVAHAVQDEDRHRDVGDPLVGAELIAHQETYRKVRIDLGADRRRGSKR